MSTRPVTRADMDDAWTQLYMFIRLDDLLRQLAGNPSVPGYAGVVSMLGESRSNLTRIRNGFAEQWEAYAAAAQAAVGLLGRALQHFQDRAREVERDRQKDATASAAVQLTQVQTRLRAVQQAVGLAQGALEAWGTQDAQASSGSVYSQFQQRPAPPPATSVTARLDPVRTALAELQAAARAAGAAAVLQGTLGGAGAQVLDQQVRGLRDWCTDTDAFVRGAVRNLALAPVLPAAVARFFGNLPTRDAADAGDTPDLGAVVQEQLEELRRKQAAKGAPRFDTRRTSLKDLFEYSRQYELAGSADGWEEVADKLLTGDVLRHFVDGGTLTVAAMYERLAPALTEVLAGLGRQLRAWADGARRGDNAAALAVAARQAEEVLGVLDRVVIELKMSGSEPSRTPAAADLARRLSPSGAVALLTALSNEGGGRGSGSGAGSGAGSGSGSGSGFFGTTFGTASVGQGGPYAAPGFLYRRIDPIRVARYLDQAQRFQESSANAPTALRGQLAGKRLDDAIAELTRDAAAAERGGAGLGADAAGVAVAADPAMVARKRNAVGDGVLAAVALYASAVRAVARACYKLHADFVGRHHADGMRYMDYWRAMPRELVPSDKLRDQLNDHDKAVRKLAEQARTTLLALHTSALDRTRAVLTSPPVTLSEQQQMLLAEQVRRLADWTFEQAARAQDLYMEGGPTLLESLGEPRVLLLYGLKALRLAVATGALRLATRVMQKLYRRRVYELEQPPPHPALLIVLALALDAAASAVIAVVLLGLRHMLAGPDGQFPIDTALLTAWAVDLLCVSLTVLALGTLIAEVVQSKKYFRYKYEGERGLRAMRDLTFYLYCVALPIPFYRLVM